ncbi:hypothetical protein KC19_VG304100 [Ceratodon purpureus]|uniref:Secreted protein n=1 Tax=Ceratodon purpureus TaxID=3225 RepID=A0A8T0HV69_CERPU|nr:hypothetical protein KC19_VG304100 [Ceratodon purpureus]
MLGGIFILSIWNVTLSCACCSLSQVNFFFVRCQNSAIKNESPMLSLSRVLFHASASNAYILIFSSPPNLSFNVSIILECLAKIQLALERRAVLMASHSVARFGLFE